MTDTTRDLTLLIVQAGDCFRPDFHQWLTENWGVWARFRQEADRVRVAGWKHYSARTLIEVLRHESNLREASGRWKLNDWYTPDLSRLYLMLDPSAAGFFETRGGAARRAAKLGVTT